MSETSIHLLDTFGFFDCGKCKQTKCLGSHTRNAFEANVCIEVHVGLTHCFQWNKSQRQIKPISNIVGHHQISYGDVQLILLLTMTWKLKWHDWRTTTTWRKGEGYGEEEKWFIWSTRIWIPPIHNFTWIFYI